MMPPRAVSTAPLLALLLLAGAVPAAPASAQQVLVSNIDQSKYVSPAGLAFDDLAQSFRTGVGAGAGFTLTSIELDFSHVPSGLTVKLATGVSASDPGTEVATLTNPSSLTTGVLTFTAPSGTVLTPRTTYWVVVEGSAGGVNTTNSDSEDVRATGWLIDNDVRSRSRTSTGGFNSSAPQSVLIRVKGTDFSGPTVTIAAGTSPVTEGTAATFTVTASQAPSSDLTVNLSVSESIGDYVAATDEGAKTVTIDESTTTASYSVTTQDDSTTEPDGFVHVAVSHGAGYVVAASTNRANVLVNDDETPRAPAACGTTGTWSNIDAVSATETSISVTFTATGLGGQGDLRICNSAGTVAPLMERELGNVPWTQTRTYTKFGHAAEAPALKAGTDYWLSWFSSGSAGRWHHVRTAGSAASVSLSLNSAGDDGTYHNGDAIEVTATFGESVTVTGTPRIPITIGSNTRHATYASGSGSTELVFSYTVVTADVDNDGIEIAAGDVDLNGGTINAGGTAAARDHGAVAASTDRKVDGGPASISTVEFINQPTGNYVTIGDSIEVRVTYDRPVTVTGSPVMRLSPAFGAGDPKLERRATYRSGSGGTALVYRYELQDGDDSGTTNVSVPQDASVLLGGTIKTGTAVATPTHAAVNSGKTVFAKRPRISSVTLADGAPRVDADLDGTAETFVGDDEIHIEITFDQDVAADTKNNAAHIQLELTIGTTHYALNHGATQGDANIIRFDAHTVKATDSDDDGITLRRLSGTNAVIKLSGGATIKGTSSYGANVADLALAADPKVRWIRPPGQAPVESLNVRGTNAAPTATNFTVATATDTDRTFAVDDFAFSDGDGDPLKEIEIVTLPAATGGTLVLNDTSFAVPATIGRADIPNLKFKPTASFDGEATFTFKVVDSFGAKSTAAATATVRVGASVALAFNPAGDDGTYGIGDAIEIAATFAQPVTVGTSGGTPRIPFTIGTATKHATYASGSGGTVLIFRYTVVVTDEDTDGIAVAENALELNGGTINVTGTSTAAALDHPAVPASATRKVDGVRPTVSSLQVSSNPGTDLTYAIGDTIRLKATFSEAVTVTSSAGEPPTWPQIFFDMGATTTVARGAEYLSGSGSTEIVFAYTVVAGDSDGDGIHVEANRFITNGGAIVDAAGNAATLAHSPVPGSAAHKVDGVRPLVDMLRVSSSAGSDQTYAIGDVISLRARFSENVTVTSSADETPRSPRIEFVMGGTETRHAVYASGTGSRDIVFSYTVAAGDASNGISVLANKLELNGGAIVDAVGNAATLTHFAVPANVSHRVDGGAPTVGTVAVSSNAGTDQTYAIGDAIDVRVGFNENVAVGSSSDPTPTWPRIALTVGTETRHAVYHSGTGTSNLVFRYVVAAGDADADGIAVAANKLELNGGAIADVVGNAATLAHTALAASADHKVDGVRPTVSVTPSVVGSEVRIAFSEALQTALPAASAFTVKLDGTTQALAGTNPVAISGNTVTLTLAAAPGAGALTVDYTRPATGTRLRDVAGNDVESFSGQSVSARPTVSKATLQGTSLKITFSQTLQTALPDASAFTVKLGGTAQTLVETNPVAISGSTVTLTLAAAPAAGSVTVSYAKPTTGNKLTGTGGHDVEGFTDQAVVRPATVVSAATNPAGDRVIISFSKSLNAADGVAAAAAYTVTVAGASQTLTSATVAVGVLILRLGTKITAGQAVTVAYAKPTTGAKLVDPDGLEIESFSVQTVTNRVPAKLKSASTLVPSPPGDSVTHVSLTFDFQLKGPVPATTVFTITAGGTAITPSEVAIDMTRLNLGLPNTGKAILPGETVTVSYAKPVTGNKLIDNNDQEVDAFTNVSVTNTLPAMVSSIEITSDPGPDQTYQAGDTIRATVTYNADVTVTTAGTPVTGPRIKFRFRSTDATTGAPHLVYESGTGTSQETSQLVFAYVVSGTDPLLVTTGIGIQANQLQLNGGTIKTGSTTTDATLTHAAIAHGTGHRVDGNTARDVSAPVLSTAAPPAVNGASLVLTFDDALDDTGTAPAASAFTVKVNGTAVNLAGTTPVAVSDEMVTLTLAEAVIDADVVTVAYDRPVANPLRNFAAGLEAATFGERAVTNNTPGVAPTVLTDPAPVVGGTRLVITFSENLDEDSTPAASAFTVMVAGNSRGVSSLSVSGATVILTLESAAVFGETVTVSYAQPTGATDAKLQDRAPTANLVANFGPLAVTNNDATAPSYSSAAVDGAALVLTFNENLDPTSEPAANAFTVLVAGSNRGVSDVGIADATVTLTLASTVTPGQAVTVRYTKPTANALQDGAQNQVETFGNQTVTNNTRAAVTGAPAVTSSPAPGDTYGLGEHIELTVTFSHAVTVTGTPQLEVAVGSTNRQAAYNRGSGTTSLVFRYTVVAADADADGIAVAADKLTLSGGTIQDAGGGAATLTHTGLAAQSGHKVDGTLTRTAVTIAGGSPVSEGGSATFTLTAAPTPAADITVNLQVAQSGNYVAAANLGEKTVTVPASGTATYQVPTVNDGTDEPNGSVTVTVLAGTGYTAGSPAAATVTVNDNDASTPPPPARPSFSRAAVSGTALTITFNRNLDTGSAPAGSAFTVTATPAGGSARTIRGTGTASVAASTVTVTLESAVAAGETVRVSYARPAANPLRGAGSGGREVTNFTGRSVANNTPTGPSAPPPQGGGVSGGGATVTLTFADELDASSTPDPGDFTITVAAASDAGSAAGSGAGSPAADDHYRVTAVSIRGATVELTISPPIPADRDASVSYTPGTRPLRTTAGAVVSNFSVTVPAATPPPPPPPTNRRPAFASSRYAFDLPENLDGSGRQPVALGVVAATDPDGDELSYALAAGGSERFAIHAGDGTLMYVGPGEDFETPPNVYELTVVATDPGGESAEADVVVTVVNVAELPVAVDDAATTDEDVALMVDVLANDADPEGTGLWVSSVSAPEHGTAEVAAGGREVLYTPAENWHGTDRFTYVAEDGNGATSEAAVEVTVRPVNDAPEAAADTASTDEDVAVSVDVLANDTDIDGDSLRVLSVSAPENGTSEVAADGRAVRYTPAENWHGTDSFTYVADDGNGGTSEAAVQVTVSPVNDVPVAVDDEASTNEDEAVTVDVLANDTDPDGDALRLTSVSAPENGTARIAAGVVLYMPAADWHGTDRFTYEVDDDQGGRASAAVAVTVLPTNDAPMPVGTMPAQSLEEGGEPARIELSPFFEDADGETLAYGAVSSDSSVVRVTVSGSVLTLDPVGYGAVAVVVAARDAGGLTATQAMAVRVSDRAARGMVSHALAGMARSHLASARMTLGRRPMASRSEASRLTLLGRDVPLSVGEAKATAERTWQGWLAGVTSRAMSQATGGSAPGSAPGFHGAIAPDSAGRSGAGTDMTLGDLFRFGDLVGDLTRFDGGRDPLRGSEFQFAFGGGQEAGAGGGGGLRFQLWGQGDVQTFRGAPSDGSDYDGELQTGYVGLDTWLTSQWMLGVAVARSRGTGDWRTGATSGALETRLVAVHPYLQWNSGATSIWAMAGAGRGDADNVRDGSGLAETSDLGLRMGLVELRRRLAASGGFSLALRADAGWAELQTETGSETLDGQTAAVDQVRFGAELSQQIRLGGLTLAPFGEAHVRRDGGAGQPGTGLELIGGLKARAGFLRLDAQGRMLAVHSATGYEEQGFSATLSLGSQGGTGPSLSVSPRWGDLASGGGDALWQDQVYGRYAAAAPSAPVGPATSAGAPAPSARDPWAVDIRGNYGLRLPGNHVLTWSASVNHSAMGPRYTTALQLSFNGSPKARPATPPVP